MLASWKAEIGVEIYPREGTETSTASHTLLMNRVEIYPREGTETIQNKPNQKCDMLKFIPVRGRKPDEISVIINTIS